MTNLVWEVNYCNDIDNRVQNIFSVAVGMIVVGKVVPMIVTPGQGPEHAMCKVILLFCQILNEHQGI